MEKKEKEIFQKVADFYDQNCFSFSQTRATWWSDLEFIRKYLKKKGRILDFGCGNGRFLDFLEKENSSLEYQGVDSSQGLIEIAQKKHRGKKFLVLKENEKLPFEDESFDLIVAVAVFHHLSPKMAEETLQELKRILKKDGKIILTVWHLWKAKYLWAGLKSFSWQKNFFSAEISFGKKEENNKRWCCFWTLAKLKSVLQKSGFSLLEKGITLSRSNKKRNYWVVGEKK